MCVCVSGESSVKKGNLCSPLSGSCDFLKGASSFPSVLCLFVAYYGNCSAGGC